MVRTPLAILAAAALAAPAVADETVGVPGSKVKFPAAVTLPADGKQVAFKLTGTALRKRAFFSVYAVGSYVQDGAAVRSAEELAAADVPKVLYLVMERDVSGADFADAFRSAIARTYGADKFAAELAELTRAVGGQSPAKGDHVLLTGTAAGLRVQIVGKADAAIKNPAFAKAVWDVYLGAKPISDDVKAGLASRLGR